MCRYAACNLLTHPSHQLLHPHIQRRCQGDEGAQARVHRGAGAGLALLELLVGVGGDAGGMGQGFLAEALGDAGALQPQAELAGDGPPLLVLAGGGGSAHDHQRRAGTDLAPPYLYGNLEVSAEMEGGEQHGWRVNHRDGPCASVCRSVRQAAAAWRASSLAWSSTGVRTTEFEVRLTVAGLLSMCGGCTSPLSVHTSVTPARGSTQPS